jgi:hypothetical protein
VGIITAMRPTPVWVRSVARAVLASLFLSFLLAAQQAEQ